MFMRIADIARRLNVSHSSAHRLAHKLKHVKVGSVVCVDAAAFEAYVREHTFDPLEDRPAPAPAPVKPAKPKKGKGKRKGAELW